MLVDSPPPACWVCLTFTWAAASPSAWAVGGKDRNNLPPQETGFLNRTLFVHGVSYRYQVYLPEDWRRDDHKLWPVILFLHGRGERGSEGMWQTQSGLPQDVRDHPERWPFVIVMPQCPMTAYWTDPPSLDMAMDVLNRETSEFNGDPRPHLSYRPVDGWIWRMGTGAPLPPPLGRHRHLLQRNLLELRARAMGARLLSSRRVCPRRRPHTFLALPRIRRHGRQSSPNERDHVRGTQNFRGGRVRLWIYQVMHHDTWTRAYNEPELPHWLLDHRLPAAPNPRPGKLPGREPEPQPYSERLTIPLHPPAIHLAQAQIDNLTGDYLEQNGYVAMTLFWQNEKLYGRNRYGEIDELAAASPTELFYPNGSFATRIFAERAPDGHITTQSHSTTTATTNSGKRRKPQPPTEDPLSASRRNHLGPPRSSQGLAVEAGVPSISHLYREIQVKALPYPRSEPMVAKS